jgi:hypothetical protein
MTNFSARSSREDLRRLLAGATPLPWTTDGENRDDLQRPYRFGPQVVYSMADCDTHPVADCSCNHSCRDEEEAANNGKLIAAAVSALGPLLDYIDELERKMKG